MNRRDLHLNALRAFEAAGRHLSFTRAAEELSVTHAAISHHVKALEEVLGTALFERRNRRVVLTEAGQVLLPVLSESLDRVAEALDGLGTGPSARALTVTPDAVVRVALVDPAPRPLPRALSRDRRAPRAIAALRRPGATKIATWRCAAATGTGRALWSNTCCRYP